MGTLKILLQRATNLDLSGDVYDQRPFCIMEYGTQKVRSKPCSSNGKDPVWETAYKFQICDSKSMTFLVKDETSKKLLGTATLDLTIALKRGKDEATIPVYTTDKYQQGTLSVKVRYSFGEDKDGNKTKSRQTIESTTSSVQSHGSKRGGKRDQSKGAPPPAADDDDLDYMSPELETPPSASASSKAADPTNPFLAPPPAAAAAPPSKSPSWAKRPSTSDTVPRASSSALSSQMSGDAAVMEDLIDMNKKLNQEVKSLKVAFDDQGQLLQARKAELEELHSMLDRYAEEKKGLEADLQRARASNGHAANAEMAKLKELQNEKADAAGQLALVERERQQAQDDLQDAQARYEKLLSEVNQLKLNLKNVTAELQQARSQERFVADEKEQLQTALRDFENNNQHQFQKVVRQLEDAQRALSAANQEKSKVLKELDDCQAALDTAKSQTEEHDYLQQQLRKAWSSNLELQNKVRQLESERSDNPVAAAAAAAAVAADNGKPSASLAAELLSENEFLKKQLIATKLELAEAKESQVVAQRNLLRATSSKRL